MAKTNGIDDLKQQYINGLQAKKQELEHELAQVNAELGVLGSGGRARSAKVSRTKTGRVRNEMNLGDAIEAAMKKLGKPAKVGDIMDAVLATGYQSGSANFRGIINQCLIKDERFEAKSRGIYGMV
ncbi:MAG: hypothetical protein AAGD32_17150 [Planctomycetota bacterium]